MLFIGIAIGAAITWAIGSFGDARVHVLEGYASANYDGTAIGFSEKPSSWLFHSFWGSPAPRIAGASWRKRGGSWHDMGESAFLFSWNDTPGYDTERFINFLKQSYNVNWVKAENIEKSHDGNTISVSAGNNSLSLSLNNYKTKVDLIIDDRVTDGFTAIPENGKLNIYKSATCLKPLTDNQKVRLGVVKVAPTQDAPGGAVVVWLECLD